MNAVRSARRVLLVGVAVTALSGCSGRGSAWVPSASPSTTTPPTPRALTYAPLPRGDWSLDFSGPAGSQPGAAIFNARTGGDGWGNGELQSYTARPQNVSLDGSGHLLIQAIRETFTGADGHRRGWTSARLDTLGKWKFTTGTLSIRMRAPTAAGMWPAFWLMGANIEKVGWPACGEVDVMEQVHGDHLHQTVHGPAAGRGAYAAAATRSGAGLRLADPAGWHEYSISRRPGVLTFRTDGRVTGVLTRAKLAPGKKWVFDGPMFLTVNLAVGGWSGVPAPTGPSSRLLIDWLRYAR